MEHPSDLAASIVAVGACIVAIIREWRRGRVRRARKRRRSPSRPRIANGSTDTRDAG